MTRLIKRYLGYLVPAQRIVDVPIYEVNYSEDQLADTDVFIGAQTKQYIRNADFNTSTKQKIFQ